MKVLRISFVILLVVSCGIAQAQKISYGPKLGLSRSTIGGDATGISFRSGLILGGFINFETVDPNVSFQPEIVFSSQGSSFDDSNDEVVYNYLNTPILFKFEVIEENIQIYFGGQPGFLLSGEFRSGNDARDVKGQLTTVDFSGVIGVGYEFGEAILNIRYNHGFISTTKNDDIGTFPLRVVQFTIGVKIY